MSKPHIPKKDYSRSERIADLLQKELAYIIQYKLKDPRLNLISITEVKVNNNLAFADVYISDLNSLTTQQNSEADVIHILNHAMKKITQHLAGAVKLRYIPKVRFHMDNTVIKGRQLSSLIEDAVNRDKSSYNKNLDD